MNIFQVKETRKSERDSERGTERMAVGHHIRDRAHIIERTRRRGGDIEENQELINLDDSKNYWSSCCAQDIFPELHLFQKFEIKNQAKSLIKFLLKIVGEKESFDREFQEKTKESMRGLEYRRRGERSDRRALPPASKKRDYRDRERN